MADADKLCFDKKPGFYWLKRGGVWEVVMVSRIVFEGEYTGRTYGTMVAVPGVATKWSIYYFAEAEWGPKIEEPAP